MNRRTPWIAPVLVVLAACATKPPAGPAPDELAHDVPIELGAIEFYGGDHLEITSVRGEHPSLEQAGRFRVEGRYELASRDTATLLLSVTETASSGSQATLPESRLRLTRGEGAFALEVEHDGSGYPHITYYGEDGRPFGGVYFGQGETLLATKSWSYDQPVAGAR